MKRIALFFVLMFCAPAWAGDPIYAVNGFAVGVFSDSKMVIEPFSFWAWGPSPGFGGQMVSVTTTLYPDVTVIGPNGMDANPNGAGHMPPDGAYNLHAFTNPTTLETIMMVSAQSSPLAVPVPAGFTLYRKMNYGAVIRNGILQPNHASSWPLPTVMFTGVETDFVVASYTASTNGWVPVNLAKLIPENARFGYFRAIITGGAATIWLSPSNVQPGNRMWKTLASGSGAGGQLGVRVDSTETLYAWVQTSGARVDLILDGFSITEVN